MSDKIPGGLAKGMSLADIAKHHKVPLKSLKAKLEQGINVEMEHTTDKAVAREIAMDHIYEDPNYYTKLKTIEREAYEEGNITFRNWTDSLQEGLYDDTKNFDLVKQNPFDIKKLADKGIVFITKPGDGKGGVADPNWEGDASVLTLYNMDKAEPWMEVAVKNLIPQAIPYIQKDQDKLIYNGKYRQILWGIDKKGLNPKDFYLYEKKDPYAISAYALELQKGLEEHLLESMIEDNMFRSNYIDFNRLERELDYIFDDLGIDINLTQHFKDRVTQRKVDKRDIMDLMSKIHDQYSQEVRFLKRDDNRVFRHLTRLLDIASVAGGIDNDGYKDLFLKTILKRNNSSEPPLRTNYTSPVLTVNENLSSYKDYIPEINKYMSENGMEIEPYPSVKFIEDDEKNANDPLGMTAFYNPAQKCVVLYTMGRHPKDILRSYAHEMVHHEQNLKGSIGDNKIQTTNTLEDDYLDKVEREAYEKGNIMFRNWTDSLKK